MIALYHQTKTLELRLKRSPNSVYSRIYFVLSPRFYTAHRFGTYSSVL